MSRNLALVVALFLAGLAGSVRPSYGQVGGVPGPFGTPVSPWMNLYQRHGGPLDNYHMFVQPAEQQQNAFQNLQYGVQNNANSINSVGEQFTSQSQAYFAAGSPTGVAAGFMNYRQYFNNASIGTGGGAFGTPGTGGLGRPGGVGQFGTPGLGGVNAGAGMTNPAAGMMNPAVNVRNDILGGMGPGR